MSTLNLKYNLIIILFLLILGRCHFSNAIYFINKCNGGLAEEQEKLLKGQFEKIKSFSFFSKNQ